MAKAIKLPDGYYWDSSSVSHDRKILDDILKNSISEVGSNSNGTWRKYANGDMECWFIQQVSVAINSQWGSLYVGTASLHDFPQTFTEIPVTQISFAPNGNQALIGRTSDNSLTRTNPGKIALFRGNVNSSVNYKIHVYAKGRWK